MLTVRAGVQRDVSGLDKTVYSPTLPDASSWGGSLGVTWRFAKAFSVDAAGFYANMDKVTAQPPAGSSEPPSGGPNPLVPTGTFRGSYDTTAFIFSASLNWQPGSM
jgi:long-subunit fatty acid transport protein